MEVFEALTIAAIYTILWLATKMNRGLNDGFKMIAEGQKTQTEILTKILAVEKERRDDFRNWVN